MYGFWATVTFSPLMVAVNGFVAMVRLLPFVWCRGVEDLLHEFIAFLGELPSPAWPVVSAGAVSVDAVDVSCSFEFDHAASQALWSVGVFHRFGQVGQSFLGDWVSCEVEECECVEFWSVH